VLGEWALKIKYWYSPNVELCKIIRIKQIENGKLTEINAISHKKWNQF